MEDLICYSFQVARGMEFLASRKVRSFSGRVACYLFDCRKYCCRSMEGNSMFIFGLAVIRNILP